MEIMTLYYCINRALRVSVLQYRIVQVSAVCTSLCVCVFSLRVDVFFFLATNPWAIVVDLESPALSGSSNHPPVPAHARDTSSMHTTGEDSEVYVMLGILLVLFFSRGGRQINDIFACFVPGTQ